MSNPLEGKSSGNPIAIRDPLYGFVELSLLERQVLLTNALQRMLRIKQLAHTYVAYPSAMHTRFEHSIGAMHVSGRVCEQLGLTEEKTEIIRLAVLLHDIGHGPFSHVFERINDEVTGKEHAHEFLGRIILKNDNELGDVLGKKRDEVLQLYEEKETIPAQILSGTLDADKLDYLRRDTHHVGATYGMFDLERVIRNLCIVPDGARNYLGILEKGQDALENYRLARYLMHVQVYEHHTRLVADDMFIRAVQFALEEGVIDKEALNPDNDVGKFLNYYLSLDDYSIQHMIMDKSKDKAKDLMSAIRQRKLYKRAFITKLDQRDIRDWRIRQRLWSLDQSSITEYERNIANRVGVDPSDIFMHLQSIRIKLYERLYMEDAIEAESIHVLRGDGTVGTMADSPISVNIADVRRLYIFCPFDIRVEVANATKEILGVENRYNPSNKTLP